MCSVLYEELVDLRQVSEKCRGDIAGTHAEDQKRTPVRAAVAGDRWSGDVQTRQPFWLKPLAVMACLAAVTEAAPLLQTQGLHVPLYRGSREPDLEGVERRRGAGGCVQARGEEYENGCGKGSYGAVFSRRAFLF